MRYLCVFSLTLILCCLSIKAQSLNCTRLRENCRPCTRRLVDPINDLEFINSDCREKLRGRWIWRDVRRCDMQIVACENHETRLDCENVARLTGMRRIR
uniref:Eig71Ej n=2 Tax=Drosophila melanogaster TaxID=7227 RepID=Q24077_DROME|eukprot:NP_648796.1 Eig71Ej [Drosophila melanogaster]